MYLQAPNSTADSQQVYLDLSVDGEPRGRLVIKLAGDAPVGTRRFAQLSQGLNGVGYRLSKFDGIAQVLLSNSNTLLILFLRSCIPASCCLFILLFLSGAFTSSKHKGTNMPKPGVRCLTQYAGSV